MAEGNSSNLNSDGISPEQPASEQPDISPALIATRNSMWLFKNKFIRSAFVIALGLLICTAIYSLYIFTRHADPAEIFIFSAAKYSPDKPFTLLVLARDAKTELPLQNQAIDLYMGLNGKGPRKLPAVKTGADGIALVPVNPCPVGEYQIKAVLRELSAASKIQVNSGQAIAVQSVTVKPYSPDNCKITIDTARAFYLPGDMVAGTVSIRDIQDKPLAATKVLLNASVTVYVTVYVSETRRRGRWEVVPRERQLASVSGITDAAGKLKFNFIMPKELEGVDFRRKDTDCKISVTAFSEAGRQQNLSKTLTVTAKPIRITYMPEFGQLLPGIPGKMYIFVSDPYGTPLETTMKIGNQVFHTGKDGLTLISLPPKGQTAVVNVTDSAGYKSDDAMKWVYNASPQAFILKTEKAVVHNEEELQLNIIANQPGGRIFIYLVKDETPFEFIPVPMDARQKQLKLKISSDIAGILQIHAYRLQTDGKATHELRLIQVMPEKRSETAKAYFQVQDGLLKPDYQNQAAGILMHEPVNQLTAGYLLANQRNFSNLQAQSCSKYADREKLLIQQKIKLGNKLFLYLSMATLILLAVLNIPFLLVPLNIKNNSYRMAVNKEFYGEIQRQFMKLQWMFCAITVGYMFFIVLLCLDQPSKHFREIKFEYALPLSIFFILLLLLLAKSVKARNRVFKYFSPDSANCLQKIILLIPWLYGISSFVFLTLTLTAVFFSNTPGLCFITSIFFILSLIPLFGLRGIQCSVCAQEYLDLYCNREVSNMGSGIGTYPRSFSSLWIVGSGLYIGPVIMTYLIVVAVIISLFLPLCKIIDKLGK